MNKITRIKIKSKHRMRIFKYYILKLSNLKIKKYIFIYFLSILSIWFSKVNAQSQLNELFAKYPLQNENNRFDDISALQLKLLSTEVSTIRNTDEQNLASNDSALQSSILNFLDSKAIIGEVFGYVANNIEERAREEIASLLMEKFSKAFISNKKQIYSKLFHESWSYLNTIKNLHNYKDHIKNLQERFQFDLKNLPQNFIYVIDSLNIPTENKAIIYASHDIALDLTMGKSLDSFFVNTAELFSQGDIVLKSNTKQFLKAFVHWYSKKESINSIELNTIMNYYFPLNSNNNLILSKQIVAEVKNITQILNETESLSFYQKLSVINSGIKILALLPDKNSRFTKTMTIIGNLANAYAYIKNNQLGNGVVELFAAINTSYQMNQSAANTFPDKKTIDFDKIFENALFMANLANAKDGKEIADIIKQTSMGVGSYRKKRTSDYTSFINSYFGGQYNYVKNEKNLKTSYSTLAPSAPIGVSFNWGHLGGFVSIIDVGNFLGVVQNDTLNLEQFPELKFSNAFAPGLFFDYNNLFNTFLSIGIGYNFGPWDRKNLIDNTSIATKGFQANIKIDMPLYLLAKK